MKTYFCVVRLQLSAVSTNDDLEDRTLPRSNGTFNVSEQRPHRVMDSINVSFCPEEAVSSTMHDKRKRLGDVQDICSKEKKAKENKQKARKAKGRKAI